MHIVDRVALVARRDTGPGHFLALLYKAGSNSVIQACINFIAAVVAGLLSYQDGKWQLGFIVPFGLIYFIILCLFSVVDTYKQKRNTRSDIQGELNKEIAAQLYGVGEETARLNDAIRDNPDLFNTTFSNSKYFENISNNVCVSVFSMLYTLFGNKRFKVSVFQQFEKDQHRWVKMIAEKSDRLDRADSYQQEYQIDVDTQNELPYFCKVFLFRDKEYAFLDNEERVNEEFTKINGHKINTKQYIGIVGKTNPDTTGFVLQICTYSKNQFGDRDSMEKLCTDVLIPYREVLRAAYNQRLLQENIVDLLRSENRDEL